ncbi:PhzF family phenazine biosynthesis protein [Deinococcus sp. UR1]|uniref:PhzF family phenazine biosynthesis protein n=1 Tax=Deinococcus sp. UR1 TaxID=1704277 RepID=UPI0006DC5B82|nr:PhzF family phenazine biosynthesis protein [Deinococcus sp. UR1]PIG97150.1 PhzF family phenazine biosynthesis protein [Deinococcus sp. UR1]
MSRRLTTVDVFTEVPFQGNPVAVVLDAQGLSGAQMQQIARWTNLSETTFLLPATTPEADYQLRIFTPGSELPFAGHPTLGSAHAAVQAGWVTPRQGRLVQECGAGLIAIEQRAEGRYALTMPPAQFEPLSEADTRELEATLGVPLPSDLPAVLIDVGARWIVTRLRDPETVLAVQPEYARSAALERQLRATGVCIFATDLASGVVEVRSFAPSCGVNEDPVCGSGNGAVAYYQQHLGLLAPGSAYAARQGRAVGRDGHLRLTLTEDGSVQLEGACVTSLTGLLMGP